MPENEKMLKNWKFPPENDKKTQKCEKVKKKEKPGGAVHRPVFSSFDE